MLSFPRIDVTTSSIVVITTAETTRQEDLSRSTGVARNMMKKREAITTKIEMITKNGRRTTVVKGNARNRGVGWNENVPPPNTRSTRNTKSTSGKKLVPRTKDPMKRASLTKSCENVSWTFFFPLTT